MSTKYRTVGKPGGARYRLISTKYAFEIVSKRTGRRTEFRFNSEAEARADRLQKLESGNWRNATPVRRI